MKRCLMCGEKKPLSEFNKNKGKKDGYGTGCRECMKVYCKTNYPKHKATILKSNRRRKVELVAWFNDYKSTLKCTVCGYNKSPYALDFHHRDPSQKDGQVGKFAREGWSRKKILEEISKCEVLCANCHRELHHEDRI